MIKKNQNALIIVDIQNDFCPDGKLAIQNGDHVIPLINKLIPKFDHIIATQDWHPENHISFAINHPDKDVYDVIDLQGIQQELWPTHCVQGTRGAEFHSRLNTNAFNAIIRKGSNPNIDSYSTFLENDKKHKTGLEGYLKGLGITQIFLAGLATDFCVLYSSLDAIKLGFETYVIIDACRGVNIPPGNVEKAIKTMQAHHINIIKTGDLL